MARDIMSKLDKKFDSLSSSHEEAESQRNLLMRSVLDLNEVKRIQTKLRTDLLAIDHEVNKQKVANKQKRELLTTLMMERDKLEMLKENLINMIDRNEIHIQDTKEELERFDK